MARKKRPAKRFSAPPEPPRAEGRVGHNTTPAYWAEQISAKWQEAAESIIETGRLLLEAKAKLKHGQWGEMFEPGAKTRLPFSHSTANKLMAIAEHPILTKSEHVPKLPRAWSTMYELTKLPDDALEDKFADDTINCEMTRDEAVALCREVRDEGLYLYWRVPESLGVLLEFARKFPDPASIASSVYNEMVEEPAPGRKHLVDVDDVGEGGPVAGRTPRRLPAGRARRRGVVAGGEGPGLPGAAGAVGAGGTDAQ